jgi:hypothetical protein
MEVTEILGGTLNIAILACFYTVFGGIISYLLFHLFDDFTEEWKKSSVGYQLLDISAEISLVGIIAFWSSHIIKEYPPLFPVHVKLDHEVDTYISGVFFAYAMFLFLEDLSNKIKFLYSTYLKTHFVKVIPESWTLAKAITGKTEKKTQKHTL